MFVVAKHFFFFFFKQKAATVHFPQFLPVLGNYCCIFVSADLPVLDIYKWTHTPRGLCYSFNFAKWGTYDGNLPGVASASAFWNPVSFRFSQLCLTALFAARGQKMEKPKQTLWIRFIWNEYTTLGSRQTSMLALVVEPGMNGFLPPSAQWELQWWWGES